MSRTICAFAVIFLSAVSIVSRGAEDEAAAAVKVKTLREKLNQKMDFKLPRTPLDVVVQQFSELLGVPIEIVGPDFELEGITKNQRVECDVHGKTVSEVLQVILLKASPADKLVFVIKKEKGKEKILVTTRGAAEKRGDVIRLDFSQRGEDETDAGSPVETPKTLREKLDEKMDFSLPNTPLDAAMQRVSKLLDVPIEMIGKDFLPEGITKNQRVSCHEKDKTVSEILQVIFLKASPADKLVFVIKEEEGREKLVVTTRAGAEKRGDAVPPEFTRPAEKDK